MKNLMTGAAVIMAVLTMASCSKNDSGSIDNGQPKSNTDTLMAANNDSTSGSVTFQYTPGTDGVSVTVHLNSAPSGTHPAKIYMGTAADAGNSAAITLNSVDGSGTSVTQVTKFDNGTAFNYDSSLNYDGYLSVMVDNSQSSEVLAKGDIGQNVLTGTSKDYGINQVSTSGLSGTITFYERKNHEALASIKLYFNGTNAMLSDGASLPAVINRGSLSANGSTIIGLNPVKMSLSSASNGMGTSNTNINSYVENNQTKSITYDDILKLDGSLKIYYSATNLVAAAQANIGANE